MIETIRYINHINEEINFGANGIFVNQNDLHDYAWSYQTENNKVSNFFRSISTKTLPVVVADSEEGYSKINSLMECAEKDVLAQKRGKIYIGEYYLLCYITGSKKTNYAQKKGYMNIELTILTDMPYWVKEINSSFSNSGSSGGKNLDFAFDFPYDFASSSNVKNIVNTSFADADFKIIIYGQATDPSINIGGHSYGVTGHLGMLEYLTIDSKNKTIILTKADGTQVNWFKNRNKNSYIFQKIPSNENAVTWSGDYKFDIVLYEERSEPKWI